MQFDQLKRRDFITLLGGGGVAARGTDAAGGDAGGRVPQLGLAGADPLT
jgi:hypothetical protein